jgi:dihydrofolate reductase
LVGSTTFKTFKGALPDRINYVATRHNESFTGATVVHDIEKFLRDQTDDVWVIGGSHIYQQVIDLHLADELYLTHIAADFGCDQFFPDYADFKQTSHSEVHHQNGFTFSYAIYQK